MKTSDLLPHILGVCLCCVEPQIISNYAYSYADVEHEGRTV